MARSYNSVAHSHRGWCIKRGIYKGSSPCWYATRPSRRGPTARKAAHGRESGECKETPRPEPSLSRAWPAPTTAWPIPTAYGVSRGGYTRGPPLVGTPRGQAAAGRRPERRPMAAKAVNARKHPDRNHRFRGHGPLLQQRGPFPPRMVHQQGDIQGVLPLLVRHAAKPPRADGPRGGPWPRKRRAQGNLSTGTIALAGMARSYNSVARSYKIHTHNGWRIRRSCKPFKTPTPPSSRPPLATPPPAR